MSVRTEEITRQMRQLFEEGSAIGLTDAELLVRFAGRSGESGSNLDTASAEAAFETLVARHGTMVLSVCRPGTGGPGRGRGRIPGDLSRVDSPVQFV
jgi:hypothetical protein